MSPHGPCNPPRANNTAIAVLVLIVVGLILLAIMGVLAAVLFPAFLRARVAATEDSCMMNLKRLGGAMRAYQANWNDACPSADTWNDSLAPGFRDRAVFRCPADKSGKPGYAMNRKLSGASRSVLNAGRDTVMLFDSVPGYNQAGGPELLPTEPRHPGGHMVVFADGHVQKVVLSAGQSLNWTPAKAKGGATEPVRRKAY